MLFNHFFQLDSIYVVFEAGGSSYVLGPFEKTKIKEIYQYVFFTYYVGQQIENPLRVK